MLNLRPMAAEVSTSVGTGDLEKIIKLINNVISAVLGIMTAVVVGVAIFIAIKFFTADSDDKRKNAKNQLIYAIIGVIVLIALMIIAPQITNAVQNSIKG